MGFEALFGQKRLRHEAGEAGAAQQWTAVDGIDLDNNTVTLRSLRRDPGPADAPEPADGPERGA